jgi:hypothetical protein
MGSAAPVRPWIVKPRIGIDGKAIAGLVLILGGVVDGSS